jgi:hypothetical protein
MRFPSYGWRVYVFLAASHELSDGLLNLRFTAGFENSSILPKQSIDLSSSGIDSELLEEQIQPLLSRFSQLQTVNVHRGPNFCCLMPLLAKEQGFYPTSTHAHNASFFLNQSNLPLIERF